MRHSNYQPTPNFLLSLRSSAWTIFPVVRPRANKQTKKTRLLLSSPRPLETENESFFRSGEVWKGGAWLAGLVQLAKRLPRIFRFVCGYEGVVIYTDLNLHGANTILFYVLAVSFKQPAVNVSLEFFPYPLYYINRLTVKGIVKIITEKVKQAKYTHKKCQKAKTKNHRQKHQTTNIFCSDRNRLFADFDLLYRCKLHPKIFPGFQYFRIGIRYILISDLLCWG